MIAGTFVNDGRISVNGYSLGGTTGGTNYFEVTGNGEPLVAGTKYKLIFTYVLPGMLPYMEM